MADEGLRTKLEEQACGKGDLSYTYFHRGAGAADVPPPKVLSKEELEAQQKLEEQRKQQGSSTWNHAGTFEERCVTPWATERLKEMFRGLEREGVTIKELTTVSGDVNIFMVRGKRRQGFSLELTLAWACGDVAGTLTASNIDSDDLDDASVSAEVAKPSMDKVAEEAAALAAARRLGGAVRDVMEQFADELRNK